MRLPVTGPAPDRTVLDSDAFFNAQQYSLDDLRARWSFSDSVSFLWSGDRWPGQVNTGFFVGRRTPHTLRMLDELINCPEEIDECAQFRQTPYHERACALPVAN